MAFNTNPNALQAQRDLTNKKPTMLNVRSPRFKCADCGQYRAMGGRRKKPQGYVCWRCISEGED